MKDQQGNRGEEFKKRENSVALSLFTQHEARKNDTFSDITAGPAGQHFQNFLELNRNDGEGIGFPLVKGPEPATQNKVGQAAVFSVGTIFI